MKVAANVSAGALRRAAEMEEALAAAALDAATDALVREVERAREAAGLPEPLTREGTPRRRLIGSRDPAAAAREFGTHERSPAPWLAPVLPVARGPMRAAARTAVARALSTRNE